MILATFPTYSQVLPGFEQAIGGLRDHLLPVMSVLMIASLIGVAKDGYRAILFHLILLTILVGLAANWQPWFQQTSTAVSATFAGDQYDLGKQTERYLVRLQVKAEQKDSDEGYVEAFFRAIMAGALLLLGYITKGIVLLFLVLQKILLTFAYALSPIFVGFFALRSTRGIAVNYLMTTVGLVSWPLGFALSACGTYGLVQFFGNAGFFSVAGNLLMLNEAFFALLIIAVWLLVSTIISPVIISKVMATGAQAGSALLAGVANTAAAATGAAVTTGATLAGGAATAGAGGAAPGGAGGGALAASGGGTAGASSSGGSAGIGAALRAATGAMLGGGASLADAAMSGGNGHGAISSAVGSVVRGSKSGGSSGSSSGKGGSPPQTAKGGSNPQTNSGSQPPASSTPAGGGGSATPPPLPGTAGTGPANSVISLSAPSPAPANTTTAGGAPSAPVGGTPVVAPPQTPNHAGTAPSGSAPVAASSSSAPGGSSSGGTPGSTGASTSGAGGMGSGRKTAAVPSARVDTSLDGEVARIIDIATGKPVAGDSLPKPGN